MCELDKEVKELNKTEQGREELSRLLGRGEIRIHGEPTLDERLAMGFGMSEDDD